MENRLDTVIAEIKASLGRFSEGDAAAGARLGEAMVRACRAVQAAQSSEQEALDRVPPLLAAFARCLPIRLEGQSLVVLAAEPVDVAALNLLESRCGPIRVETAPFDVVWEGLQAAYRDLAPVPEVLDETPAPEVESPEPTPPLATTAPSDELEVAATDAPPVAASESATDLVREATDEDFADLMADVERQATEEPPPTDIHEPRVQNLDLLEAFEALSTPVNLTDPIEAMSPATAGEGGQPAGDPAEARAEMSRLDALLGESEPPAPTLGSVPDDLVPAELAFRTLCAPIGTEEGELVCLIADPPDLEGAEKIAQAAAMPLRLRVCAKEEVLTALETRYGPVPDPAFLVRDTRAKAGLIDTIKKKLKKSA